MAFFKKGTMHTLVVILSVAVVVGLGVWAVQAIMGQFAILVWIGVGFFAFLGLMAKVNSS